MTSCMFNDTRSHDTFMAGKERLTELAEAGTLTRELLDEAMKAMYDDGDYIDRSIGFAWITENVGLFAKTAARLGFKVAHFLHAHGSLCWVGSRVLLYRELVALVPESEREEFVKQIYHAHGAFNDSWIGVVTSLGIKLSVVAELIHDKLMIVSYDCEQSNVVNAVWEFLDAHGSTYPGDIHWGMLTDARFSEMIAKLAEREPARFFADRVAIEGRIGTARYEELAKKAEPRRHEPAPHFTMSWEPSPWAALNDAQFLEAMAICARKAPRHFATKRTQIEERIGKDAFKDLTLEALTRLDKLTEEQQKFVLEQPLSFQLQVARTLNGNADFIIGVILKLNQTDGEKLFAEKKAVFDATHIASLYRSTWGIRHSSDSKPRAAWLERELESKLTEAGYIMGTVTEGTFTPRGASRPQRQLQVIDNGCTYVVERGQRDYYPRTGDVVLINTRTATRLTPRVLAATFLPAHSGQKVSY